MSAGGIRASDAVSLSRGVASPPSSAGEPWRSADCSTWCTNVVVASFVDHVWCMTSGVVAFVVAVLVGVVAAAAAVAAAAL